MIPDPDIPGSQLPEATTGARPDQLHEPVLVDTVLTHLNLANAQTVVDATLGLGGHAAQILGQYRSVRVIGVDRDPETLRLAAQRLTKYASRLTIVHANFADMVSALPAAWRPQPGSPGRIDAILLDLGISSWQLAKRGFSFQQEAPLDFRMDPTRGSTAAELIAGLPESELADLLYRYGEEQRSRRIAAMIVTARRRQPIRTTVQLAEVVAGAVGRRGRLHPATKAFQALRIAVNDELGSLQRGLTAASELLRPGGRLAVISFQSLEDRLVKRFISGSEAFERVNKKVIRPSREEIMRNPRARSAKLRVAERTAVQSASDEHFRPTP